MINGGGEGGVWIWIHLSATIPLAFVSPAVMSALCGAFLLSKGQFIQITKTFYRVLLIVSSHAESCFRVPVFSSEPFASGLFLS